MASITLYNKWRPQTFADPQRHPLVGQEHVTRTLRNAVARSQIAHAYLFCGPRGTGKTSAARILARAVNCRRGMQGEPCNECENCLALLSGRQLDLLIEIDGASNRGVDDVRQLRERLLQRPGGADLTGRYKVYIIDEVHMLTQEAFNALLKSLEEPPAHVVFVLATTDPQKVPATVASRCQRFDFKPISLETLVHHLTAVASAEGVRLDPLAAELLARAASGGARDAISLLDQALAFAGAGGAAQSAAEGPGAPPPGGDGPLPIGAPTINAGQVQAMLGLTSFEAVCRLVDSIVEGDLPAGLRLVHEVASQGIDLRQFTRQVLELLRALLLAESDAGALLRLDDERQEAVQQRARRLTLPDLVRLIKLFTQAEQGLKAPSAQPQLPLELAIVEASLASAPPPQSLAAAPPPQSLAPAPPPQSLAAAPPPQALATPAPPAPQALATPAPPAPQERAPLPTPAPTRAAAPAPAVAEGPPPTWPAPTPAPAPEAPAPEAPALDAPAPPATPEPESERAPAQLAAEPSPPVTATPASAAPAGAPSRATAPALSYELVLQRWPAVMEAVRQSSKSVEALLRGGKPSAVEAPNVVVLEFLYDFHRKKIVEAANRVAVEKALRRVLGVPARIKGVQAEGATLPFDRPRSQTAVDDPVVGKAMRIWRAHVLSPDQLAEVESLPPLPDPSRL